MTRTTFGAVLLLVAVLLGQAAAEPVTEIRITQPTTWSGEVSVASRITVAPGTELTLAAGTRLRFSPGATLQVEGALVAAGTAAAPILLLGDRGSEAPLVIVSGDTARLTLAHTEVREAGTGITVRGGSITASRVHLRGNGTGLALEVKGRATLEGVSFTDNDLGLSIQNNSSCEARRLTLQQNRVGLAISNGSRLVLEDSRFTDNQVGYGQQNACDAQLVRCTFDGNQTGVGLRQTRRSPIISFATFRDNQIAVAAQLFSHVVVEASTLIDNRKGFSAVNFCGAYLRYNTFRGNDQAILLDHKSNARIENNRIENNRVGLFADYSSYPNIKDNLFTSNEWHVRLGIYQSADWEQRQGSRGLMMKAAKGANSRNPMMLSGDVPTGANVFSVAGNAWDTATHGELGGGDGANISRFWDGLDQEPVRYEGFGEGKYRVDVIRFAPPRSTAGLPLGPDAWQPLQPPPGAPPPAATNRRGKLEEQPFRGDGIIPAGAPPVPATGVAPPGRP